MTGVASFLCGIPYGVYGDSCENQRTDGFVSLVCYSGTKLDALYNQGAMGDLSGFVNRFFFASISIGGMLAVIRLVWAGYEYMASDLWTDKEKAKQIIKDTMLGIVLLIAVWIILNQINPHILDLQTYLPART